MNSQQMIDRFLMFVGDPHQDNYTSETAIEFLNQALEDLQNMMVRSPQSFVKSYADYTVDANATGVEEKDLPSGFRRAIRVENTSTSGRPTEIEIVEFSVRPESSVEFVWEEVGQYPAAKCYIAGDVIGFICPSGYTARLHYEGQYTSLSISSTDECEAPKAFHGLIVLMAAVTAMDFSGRKVSSRIENQLNEQKSLFISFLARRQKQNPEYTDAACSD